MASSRGFRTLSCRTSESETTFSYVGLADLLRAVADAVLPELPPIQRRALEAALLIGESETQVDERAVAAAFLAALRLVAADGTSASPSTTSSGSTMRRSPPFDSRCRVSTTSRSQRFDGARRAGWIRRSLPETRLVTVELDGLSIGARIS